MKFFEDKIDFESIYDRYADMLYRLAFSHLQNKEDAEDVVQDVFLKYLGTIRPFLNREHEQAWLIRVTVNACYDFLRKKKYRMHVPIDEIEESLLKEDEILYDVSQMLDGLPPKYKTVMLLYYFEGYSVEEISHILKLSKSAVKMRLSRSRTLLKEHIEKEDGHV